MPGIMDAPPEASQHEDVMTQMAHQLNASMQRVRQARELLHEASDRLGQTRREVEKDERIERVRRAREHLDRANQQLTQTRQQVEDDQHPNAVGPTTDD
jgi:chromosome segregation ATPase